MAQSSSSSSATPTINSHIDYYALLGIANDADDSVIKKAYRRKALELHPDKNRDNPKADELFHMIKQASDLLLDPTTRKVIDQNLQAKAVIKARHAAMDDKRKKLREELEYREKQAQTLQNNKVNSSVSSGSKPIDQQYNKQYTDELRKLQIEGADLLREYTDRKQRQQRSRNPPSSSSLLHRPNQSSKAVQLPSVFSTNNDVSMDTDNTEYDLYHAIRIHWNDTVHNQLSGGGETNNNNNYNTQSIGNEQLLSIFKLYGTIQTIIGKKRRSAVILFTNREAAEAAIAVPPDGIQVHYVIDDNDDDDEKEDTTKKKEKKGDINNEDNNEEEEEDDDDRPTVTLVSGTSISSGNSSVSASRNATPRLFPSGKPSTQQPLHPTASSSSNNVVLVTIEQLIDKENDVLTRMEQKKSTQ